MKRNGLTTTAGPAAARSTVANADAQNAQAKSDRDDWATALVGFAFFVLTVVIVHDHVVATMAAMWISSSAFHHAFLAAPIAIWMIATNVRQSPTLPQPYLPAILLFALANLTWLIGAAASVQLIEQLSFVLMIIAGFMGIFGRKLAAENAFALGFLFFMAPFGDFLLPALQAITAEIIVSSLNVVGVDTRLDGVMITTPAGRFEVAEACAGLQFLVAAIMVAALVAHLAFANWRKKIAFIAGAIIVGIVANWIRAFAIVLIASKTDMQFGVGREHLILGWVFYSVLMIALVAAGRRFADLQIPIAAPVAARLETPHYASKLASVFLITTVLMLSAALVYGRLVVQAPPATSTPSVLPFFNAPGWRLSAPSADWRPAFVHADRVVHATYINESSQVFVSHAYFNYDRQGAEIGGYDSEAGQYGEWRRVHSTSAPMMIEGQVKSARVHVLEHPSGARIAVTRLFWLGDTQYYAPMRLKSELAKQKLRGVHHPGGVVYLAAPIDNDEVQSVNAIRSFLLFREPLSNWLDRLHHRSDP